MNHQNPHANKNVDAKVIDGSISTINDLIFTLTGNNDIHVNPDVGSVHGKRRVPNVHGELITEEAVTGFIAFGFENYQTSDAYFSDKPFVRLVSHLIVVTPKSKSDYIKSIEDAEHPVEAFAPIYVMSLNGQMIADALIVALDRLGYVADVKLVANALSNTARDNNGFADKKPEVISIVRITENLFISKWSAFYGVQRSNLDLPMPSKLVRQPHPMDALINKTIKSSDELDNLKPTNE